jgi:hypothetical protein
MNSLHDPHPHRRECDAMSEITFTAEVYKVQTISADHGVRITLSLPEDAIPQMAMLAEAQRQGIPILFEAI